MYLNTFLTMFGLNPDDFINEPLDPVIGDDGKTIINIRQRTDVRICPECGCKGTSIINNYFYTNTRVTSNDGQKIVIRIKKARFRCKECNHTYTNKLNGIARYSKISDVVNNLIVHDFYKQKSFSIIAKDYDMSITQVMSIFDRSFPYIRRGNLPAALCIDEIGFKTEDGSYACILYDFDKKTVVDVIRNRQNAYLKDYFSHCYYKERMNVRYFISDLYEGYVSIKEEFFPNAIHIADMFHVIRLLRYEVSRLRKRTYRTYLDDGDSRKIFMKQHWDYFECFLTHKLAHSIYYSKSDKFEYTVWSMMKRCLELDQTFWDAYSVLQDVYELYKYKDFNTVLNNINRIIKLLQNTQDENLVRLSETYYKWRYEIANALIERTSDDKRRYSNGPAEGLNNAIKTIIKDANGYQNFERFRKRVLLILNVKKTQG